MTTELTQFDNRDVIGATIKVSNAGDGLSAAMKIAPREFHHGERVYVVMETTVDQVTHVESKDDPARLVRSHRLKAGMATIVDFKLVSRVLDEQQKAIDKAKGIEAIPFGKDVSNPADWETAERTPGGEPAVIGDLAKQAAKKVGAKRAPKPKEDVPT